MEKPSQRSFASRILLLVFALLALGQSSCCKQKIPELKLAISHWAGYEFFFVAQEKGLFKKAGVRVRLVEYTSLHDVLEAYRAGDVDGMACTQVEVLLAATRPDRHPLIFLVADYAHGGNVILSRTRPTNPGELREERIAYEPYSFGNYLLLRSLSKYGRESRELNIQQLPEAEMAQAFQDKRIDVLVTRPPLSIQLMESGQAHPIYSDNELDEEILDVVVVDKEVIDNNPEAIQRIQRAWFLARNYGEAHEEEACEIMSRRLGLSPEEYEKAMEQIVLVNPENQPVFFKPEGILDDQITAVQSQLIAMGMIRREIDISTLIGSPPLPSRP